MNKQILIYTIACFYFFIATYLLFIFQAGPLLTTLVLFALPSYFLAKSTALPFITMCSICLFGVGIGLMVENIAYMYGLWAPATPQLFTLYGFISIEMVITYAITTLFLVLLYESLSDDMEYSTSNARKRFTSFGIFTIGVLMLTVGHSFLFKSFESQSAYYWVIFICVASSLAALSFQKALSARLFEKLVYFSAIASFPLIFAELLHIWNGHVVFGNTLETVRLFSLNTTVPLGMILFIFTFPFFVATVYEMYLDDRK